MAQSTGVLRASSRLTPSKNLGVESYQEFLSNFMRARSTRDLSSLLSPLSVLSWKCSPKAWALCDFSDLLKHILFIERKGILSHVTLVEAVLAEDAKDIVFLIICEYHPIFD